MMCGTSSLHIGGGVCCCEQAQQWSRGGGGGGGGTAALPTMAITANMHINGNLLSNARGNDSESTGRACADRGGGALSGFCLPLLLVIVC